MDGEKRAAGARRAKIVATLGPASHDPEVLDRLIGAGADVVRLNLAHGSIADHQRIVTAVRDVASKRGRHVGVLVDLPGPKLRSGPLAAPEVVLEPGARFTLRGSPVVGDATQVSTTMRDLASLVRPGDEVYLADGEIVLRVQTVSAAGDVATEVMRGGILRPRKGMHLPGAEDKLEAFTRDDEESLASALSLDPEFVGVSFVRRAADLDRVRASLRGRSMPLLVAKIETRAAVENLGAVTAAADAVMVARGDLGIQLPLESVPLVQKDVINTCNCAGKPVITATQMLESMTRAPLPTRAEVSDVANAVLDGTDALMLSEETAVGRDPVGVVETMDGIIRSAEGAARAPRPMQLGDLEGDPVSWAVAGAAVKAALDIRASAIVCPTRSGATARRVASFRPAAAVAALCYDAQTAGALNVVWGVSPLLAHRSTRGRDEAEVEAAVRATLGAGLVEAGDLVVFVAGSAGPEVGSTDWIRVKIA